MKKLFENLGGNQFKVSPSLKEQAGSKVLVLLLRTPYEGDELIGVYSSEQSSKKGEEEYLAENGEPIGEFLVMPATIDGPNVPPH